MCGCVHTVWLSEYIHVHVSMYIHVYAYVPSATPFCVMFDCVCVCVYVYMSPLLLSLLCHARLTSFLKRAGSSPIAVLTRLTIS